MSDPTKLQEEPDAGGAAESVGEMPRRSWREEPQWEDSDPDDDTATPEIDVRPMGSVYASRSELFEAVREIKERLRR